MKDDDFDVPEAEEVIEDDNEDDVINREEDLPCQMAWALPTLKKCPQAND